MTQEIKDKVSALLANAGVTFTAEYVAEVRREDWNGQPCDEWRTMFTYKNANRDGFETFPYFTGLGLRKVPEWKFGTRGYDNGPKPRPGSLLHAEWQSQGKPQKPHAADVLHSLILDSGAADQSFSDWCADFGYSDDSIKAQRTYFECQKIASKMRKMFSRDTIAALHDALQDY